MNRLKATQASQRGLGSQQGGAKPQGFPDIKVKAQRACTQMLHNVASLLCSDAARRQLKRTYTATLGS